MYNTFKDKIANHNVIQSLIILCSVFITFIFSYIFCEISLPEYIHMELLPRLALLFFAFLIGYIYFSSNKFIKKNREFILVNILSIYFTSVLIYLFKDINYGLNGVHGDAGFITAIVTKFKYFWKGVDFNYKNLSAFYPPLYLYILGKLAWLLDIKAHKIIKVGFIASIFSLPLVNYYFWKNILSKKISLLLTFLIGLGFFDFNFLYKPFEYWSVILFVPWWIIFIENINKLEMKRYNYKYFVVIGGFLGGLIFQTYYYWFFVAGIYLVITFIIESLRKKKFENIISTYKHKIFVLSISSIFSIGYWGPLILDFLKFGINSLQNRWFRIGMLHIPEHVNFSTVGIILLIGLIHICINNKNKINFVILIFLVSSYVWYLVGYLGILIDKPVLHGKVRILMRYLLIIGFVLFIKDLIQFQIKKIDINKLIVFILILVFIISGQSFITIKDSGFYRNAVKQETPTDLLEQVKKSNHYEGKVFLTNNYILNKYLPIFYFINNNAHYSHPASRFKERIQFLLDITKSSSSKFLNWILIYNKFDKVDYVFLKGKNKSIRDDNFPHKSPYKRIEITFNKKLLKDVYFKKVSNTNIYKVKNELKINDYKNFNIIELFLIKKYGIEEVSSIVNNLLKMKINSATQKELHKLKKFLSKNQEDEEINNLVDKKIKQNIEYSREIILNNKKDKIKFLGYSVNQIDNYKVRLRLYLIPLKDIDYNYKLWLHGYVKNKSLLSKKRKEKGFQNWDHGLQLATKNWKEGYIYIDEKIINIKPGEYKLKFGLWVPNVEGKTIRLYNNSKQGINLGWFNFKEKSISLKKIGDFETGTYKGWKTKGKAFDNVPATGAFSGQNKVTNWQGDYFINSYYKGADKYQGSMVSQEFKITQNNISFLIGGGDYKNKTYVSLIINGKVIKKATGKRSEHLSRVTWDVSKFKGKKAKVKIVDKAQKSWGHILFDDLKMIK